MVARLVALGIGVLLVLAGTLGCFYVVEPGERGVHVTLGTMADQFLAPGFGMKMPLITQIWRVNVQQDTREVARGVLLVGSSADQHPAEGPLPDPGGVGGLGAARLRGASVREADPAARAGGDEGGHRAADRGRHREVARAGEGRRARGFAREGREPARHRGPRDRGRRALEGARAGDRSQDGPAAGGREGRCSRCSRRAPTPRR